ncbi:TPA: hypothetical protein ACH3X2_007377 [Trebouxia sp. C0005]
MELKAAMALLNYLPVTPRVTPRYPHFSKEESCVCDHTLLQTCHCDWQTANSAQAVLNKPTKKSTKEQAVLRQKWLPAMTASLQQSKLRAVLFIAVQEERHRRAEAAQVRVQTFPSAPAFAPAPAPAPAPCNLLPPVTLCSLLPS